MRACCVLNPVVNLPSIAYFLRVQGNGALGAARALLLTDVGIGIAALALSPSELRRPAWRTRPAASSRLPGRLFVGGASSAKAATLCCPSFLAACAAGPA